MKCIIYLYFIICTIISCWVYRILLTHCFFLVISDQWKSEDNRQKPAASRHAWGCTMHIAQHDYLACTFDKIWLFFMFFKKNDAITIYFDGVKLYTTHSIYKLFLNQQEIQNLLLNLPETDKWHTNLSSCRSWRDVWIRKRSKPWAPIRVQTWKQTTITW